MNEIRARFRSKKLLTRPLLKFQQDEARYVKIQGPVYLGKEMKEKPGEKKREPAHVADVIDLETGELSQIIVSAVVLSVLNEEYPNNAYVDKCFSITKLGKQPGKQYFAFRVEEIEDSTAAAQNGASAEIPQHVPPKESETPAHGPRRGR